jgi:ribosomal protein S21
MIHVEINRGSNENPTSVLKRFTRKVQSAGIISRVKSLRYSERQASSYTRKKRALKSIARKTETMRLAKLGKLPERTYGR